MEQTPQVQSPAQPAAESQPLPPSSSPHHHPPFSLPPSTIPSSSSNPNPDSQTSQVSLPFNRPWEQQQQQPPVTRNFSSPPFSTSAPSSTLPLAPSQGGGMAIGVPAHHVSAQMPPASFQSLNATSYRQHQFGGGLARTPSNALESVANPSTSQVRPPIQGNQGMGMRGSMGSSPPMRPGGMPLQHQQRPAQSSIRPQTTPSNQLLTSQNFQGHGMSRVSNVGAQGSPSPSTSQGMQLPHCQPLLSSAAQGKPPLPNSSYRPQMNSQSLQQRSHIPQQQHHSASIAAQPSQTPPSPHVQQQSSSSPQEPQENDGQQFPPSRFPPSLPHQQQISKGPGFGNQKATGNIVSQPSIVSTGLSDNTTSTEVVESCDRILSKRSIQELVAQVDPSEKLDPEVEDILVDIAEEFVESITTSGCSLAKHRKSTTLEAKDILLHLDRTWNMTLPGFTGDEIKCYRKPFVNDIHKERLAVIRKSAASDATKSSMGQAAGTAKGHLTKAPPSNVLGSPDSKIREAA